MSEVRNATIRSLQLGPEDHGIFTAFVHLDYGSSGQGFGGYALYSGKHGSDYTGFFVSRVLETVGAAEWSDLVGKPVRARMENGRVHALGNFLDDRWFEPSVEFETLKGKP